MESSHPDERPVKKRRFFIEDSSPAPVRSKPANVPPSSPPPQPQDNEDEAIPDRTNGDNGEDDFGSFDVGMLQAVVGELSVPTLQKLKDVSGSDVQRGRQAFNNSQAHS